MTGFLLALALIAGCGPAPTTDVPAPSLAAPGAMPEVRLPAEVTQVRFALTPYLTPESLLRQHEGFRAWLERRLHVPVQLVVADSYDGLAAMMERHEADVAAFSPYAYVRAQHEGTRFRPIVSIIAFTNYYFSIISGYFILDRLVNCYNPPPRFQTQPVITKTFESNLLIFD